MPNTVVHYQDDHVALLLGDAYQTLDAMAPRSINCIVTSPPYWNLRDYGSDSQYGQEPTVGDYVANLRKVFRRARGALTDGGTLWLNLGDRYDQAKNLIGLPWKVVFALQSDGWILRSAVIWHKTNAAPESVADRPSLSHEYVFLLAKSRRYTFHLDDIKIPASGRSSHKDPERARATRRRYAAGIATPEANARFGGTSTSSLGSAFTTRNPGTVWSMATRGYRPAHFATFPIDIPLRCITASTRAGDVVLDPFSGAATTGLAALQLGRRYIGIDINRGYHDLARERLGPFLNATGSTGRRAV